MFGQAAPDSYPEYAKAPGRLDIINMIGLQYLVYALPERPHGRLQQTRFQPGYKLMDNHHCLEFRRGKPQAWQFMLIALMTFQNISVIFFAVTDGQAKLMPEFCYKPFYCWGRTLQISAQLV